MTPVLQTIHGSQGNCYEACLASILDLSLADVPELSGPSWGSILRQWLGSISAGVRFERGNRKPFSEQEPAPLAIVGLRTITGYVHSVICEAGKIIHDPSPRPLSNPAFPVVLWSFIECQS